jgi:hypothetical protein
MLQKAMQRSTRCEERRPIPGRAAAVHSIERRPLVVSHLDQKELAERACRTVADLDHPCDLWETNKAESETTLRKVVRIFGHVDAPYRAKHYVQGL